MDDELPHWFFMISFAPVVANSFSQNDLSNLAEHGVLVDVAQVPAPTECFALSRYATALESAVKKQQRHPCVRCLTVFLMPNIS